MASTVASREQIRQSTSDDHKTDSGSTPVDQFLEHLRRAMADAGYSLDALAAALESTVGRKVDKGYLWRMLNGEKAWTIEYHVSMPLDMARKFEQLRAESFGLIAVECPTSRSVARRMLVAGLLGCELESLGRLPMAKADVPASERRTA